MESTNARPRGFLLKWLRVAVFTLVCAAIGGITTLYLTRVQLKDEVYTISTTRRGGPTQPPLPSVRVVKGPIQVFPVMHNQTVVIAVGCNAYQLWQQVVAVYSLKRMQQKHGFTVNIQRVISCEDPDAVLFGEWLSPYHLAPEFERSVGKTPYAPLNKPGAILHWLTHGTGRLLRDDHEIIVVDSDFLFIGPIANPLSQLGSPVGAHVALGDMFLKSPEVAKLCKNKCGHWTKIWQSENEIGPPYAFRKRDGLVLVNAWYELTVAMLKGGKFQYYFDMFAYMIGSLLHDLPHKVVWGMSLVNKDEIWDRLNATSLQKVWAFHYANNYKFVEEDGYQVWFHKHQYKNVRTVHDLMLSCSASEQYRIWSESDIGLHRNTQLKPDGFNPAPWLKEPYNPPAMMLFNKDQKIAKTERSKWVMWIIYQGINEALALFRADRCG